MTDTDTDARTVEDYICHQDDCDGSVECGCV